MLEDQTPGYAVSDLIDHLLVTWGREASRALPDDGGHLDPLA